MVSGNSDRQSVAEIPELIADPDEKAEAEARNGLRQFDLAISIIDQAFDPEYPSFALSSSILLQLQQVALEGISPFAGAYRPGGVDIGGSKHEPPDSFMVPKHVEDLCLYVTENWDDKSAIQLAAFVMWRLNWIHPFGDGNGRTSRMAAYLVLNAKLGYKLPGTRTIPEFIAENKKPYYEALEKADQSLNQGSKPDLSEMETLLADLLSRQLLTVVEDATGQTISADQSQQA